jgi:hypothetical protein
MTTTTTPREDTARELALTVTGVDSTRSDGRAMSRIFDLPGTEQTTERGEVETIRLVVTTYHYERAYHFRMARQTMAGGLVRESFAIGRSDDRPPVELPNESAPRFSRKTLAERHAAFLAIVAPRLDEAILWALRVRPRYVVHYKRGDYQTIALRTNDLAAAEARVAYLHADTPGSVATIEDTEAPDPAEIADGDPRKLRPLHVDTPGPYSAADGTFSTLCDCGEVFASTWDQDSADFLQAEHAAEALAKVDGPTRSARTAWQLLGLRGELPSDEQIRDAIADFAHLAEWLHAGDDDIDDGDTALWKARDDFETERDGRD